MILGLSAHMICSICNKRFIGNELIIRAVVCKVLDANFEEVECVGDSGVLDMHKSCFEQQGQEQSVDVVEVKAVVERSNALGCFT